jgi:hypothetical protein
VQLYNVYISTSSPDAVSIVFCQTFFVQISIEQIPTKSPETYCCATKQRTYILAVKVSVDHNVDNELDHQIGYTDREMLKPISISTRDMTPTNKQECVSRLSDPYGSLATISKNEGIVISPISQWDLVQKRAWPPLTYQAYCAKHFLQECLVYYSLENKKLDYETERIIEVTASVKSKKSDKIAPTPTRVQPRRGAKKAPVSEKETSKREPKEIRDAKARIQGIRQNLQLHLSWSAFSKCIETEITTVRSVLSSHHENTTTGNQKRSKKPESIEEEFGNKLVNMECRYCQLRPSCLSDLNEMAPPRIAPVAPMHIISSNEIEEEQVVRLGALEFAVGVSNEGDKIVLLAMNMVDDLEKPQGRSEDGSSHKKNRW